MKITRILLLVPLLLGLAPGLRAQQLTLQPPLSQAFPLDVTAAGVRVPYPVLINDHTILRPDAILHFIFIDPNAGLHPGSGGAGGGMTKSHVGPHGTLSEDGDKPERNADGSAAWGDFDGNDSAGIFDNTKKSDAKQDKAELRHEVWTQKDLFAEALDHAAEDGTTVVYALPGQANPSTATFDLPEGMLLAEVDAHIRVLALDQQSRAYRGGIRPGDEIHSLGPDQPVTSLADFMRAYRAVKRQAKLSGNSTYTVEVSRPGDPQTVSIQIAAPPSIPSFF